MTIKVQKSNCNLKNNKIVALDMKNETLMLKSIKVEKSLDKSKIP